jgi:hypothetical protein
MRSDAMEGEKESPVTNIDNIAPRDGRRELRERA